MADLGRFLRARSESLAFVCGLGVVVSAGILAFAASRFGGGFATAGAQATLALFGVGGSALLWNRTGRRAFVLVLAVAIVARIALLGSPPIQSNDIYRYLWDGRLLVHGIDPYVVAPDAARLHELRRGDWLYPHIDWRAVPTLYPPFDLALFTLGSALAAALHVASVVPLKIVLLCGDLATVALLVRATRADGKPIGRVALYAWNPLVIVEFALDGHEESWTIAWLVLTLLALRRGTSIGAGFALAGAVLGKLYPAAFAPALFARRANFVGAAACAAVVALAYAPFVWWNRDVLGFLHAFAFRYHFNDSLHLVLGTIGSAALFGFAIVLASVAARAGVAPVVLIVALELAYLLASPNVYPWYVAVFVALLPLWSDAFSRPVRPLSLALVAWTVLAPLAYLAPWVFAAGSPLDIAAHVLEYAPLAIALGFLALRNARRIALACAAVTFGGCAGSAHPIRPPTTEVARGAAFYATQCAVCHTPTRSSFIGPDLTDVAGRRTATDLAHHLATAVPATRPLSAQTVRALIAYFNALHERSIK